MILETGNMWSVFGKTDLWLFTGNSCVTKGGELVMGRGLALEVKNKCPGIARMFGIMIGSRQPVYGLKVPSEESTILTGGQRVGVFQVKQHFKDAASLALIGYSVIRLKGYIKVVSPKRIDLNFPGIGYGKLPREQVLPVIDELPDCVHVWEFDKKAITSTREEH